MSSHSRREILSLLLGCSALTTGCVPVEVRERLAVFDAVVRMIGDNYFDPSALNDDWRVLVRRMRIEAAKSKDRAALYLDVMQPMLEQFDASHIKLSPPGNTLDLPSGRTFRLPPSKRGQRPFYLSREDEVGMGASFAWDGHRMIVAEIVPDQIAERAGLSVGDTVLLRRSRRTPQGGELSLINHRDNHDTKLVWTPKAPQKIETRPLGKGAIHLRFDDFDTPSIDGVLAVLAQNPDTIVLDLRANEGGSVKELHRLLSALLPSGTNLGKIVKSSGPFPFRTGGDTRIYTGRLVTLIGLRSASAAEITAACLRHYGRSPLLGQRTAGAVLVSSRHNLPDGGLLQLPFADYRDPAGRKIEGLGVVPDVETPLRSDAVLPGTALDHIDT